MGCRRICQSKRASRQLTGNSQITCHLQRALGIDGSRFQISTHSQGCISLQQHAFPHRQAGSIRVPVQHKLPALLHGQGFHHLIAHHGNGLIPTSGKNNILQNRYSIRSSIGRPIQRLVIPQSVFCCIGPDEIHRFSISVEERIFPHHKVSCINTFPCTIDKIQCIPAAHGGTIQPQQFMSSGSITGNLQGGGIFKTQAASQ